MFRGSFPPPPAPRYQAPPPRTRLPKKSHNKVIGICNSCGHRIAILRNGLCGKHKAFPQDIEVCPGYLTKPEKIVAEYDF